VFYKFADPDLEALSAGQKILIRIGPDNAFRVKAKLRVLKPLTTCFANASIATNSGKQTRGACVTLLYSQSQGVTYQVHISPLIPSNPLSIENSQADNNPAPLGSANT